MKLKKSRKNARTCASCNAPINKGDLYSQKSKTILFDKEGQSINNGRTWEPLRISKKLNFCEGCSNG